MEQKIDKKVLEYMGIYKTKEVTQEKINLGLKVKEEISKLTNLKIERVYLMDEYAWGENDGQPAFCFLTDVRIKEIDEKFNLIKKYAFKSNVNILFWSLCQFEKRKNNPTELDYYIERYGNKIYDTGKLVDIDERVKVTQYASMMDYHRYISTIKIYNPEPLMKFLLEIYALKIDYPVNQERNLEETIKYIKYISKDKIVLNAIEEFTKEGADKFSICDNLEEYIKNLKQIRPKMELKNKPTMNVYEWFLDIKNKEGKLSIENLTKENLYTMEVIQEKMPLYIAKLFDVNESEILRLRKKFGYKVLDSIWYKDIEALISKAFEQEVNNPYELLKRIGILNFEKHTYDILKYMRDGEKYLLKEFWKLLKGNREGLEVSHAKTSKDVNFRAYFCLELLKQNEFIEEKQYLTYKITEKGKRLLERLSGRNVGELNLIEICNLIGESTFYTLSIAKLSDDEFLFYDNSNNSNEYYDKIERNEKVVDNIAEEDEGVREVSFEDVLVRKNSNSKEKTQNIRRKTDYNKINTSKEKVGKDCEKLIYDLEKERLTKEKREDLAKEVVWESEENGDGAGYDIKSFENKNGEYIEIYIEVKGTNKSVNEPFEISKNEVKASNEYKERYYIYRVGNIYSKPTFYKINGRIEDNFKLEAISFKAKKK